jgi:thiamine biosynthesis lipoprotein
MTSRSTPAAPPRHVALVETMGTVVTVDVRASGEPSGLAAAVQAVERRLHRIDDDFSPWRPRSWVSRLIEGRLTLEECPAEVRHVIGTAHGLAELTDGYFSPFWRRTPRRPGPDPTGLVKGWAAQQASDVLLAHGLGDHVVNAAGDLVLSGAPDPGTDRAGSWRVGIADPVNAGPDRPDRPPRLAGAVVIEGGRARWAVATSGVAELGPHVLDPHTGEPPATVASATVVERLHSPGDEAGARADACATALVAAGDAANSLVRRLEARAVTSFLIAADGSVDDPFGLLRR